MSRSVKVREPQIPVSSSLNPGSVPWCVLGDFNFLLSALDKINFWRRVQWGLDELNDVFNSNDLVDI